MYYYNLRAYCHCEAEGRGNPVKEAAITGLPRSFASRNDKVNCEARESAPQEYFLRAPWGTIIFLIF